MRQQLICKKSYRKILNRKIMRKDSKRLVKKNHPVYQICKSTLIRSIARGKTKKEPFYKFAQKSTLFNAKH